MNEMLWIAVPGGVAESGRVPLRALAVPRLDAVTPTSLDQFGLADWPAIVNGASLTLEVGTTIDGPADALASTRVSTSSSDVWKAFFSPDIKVNPRLQRAYNAPFVPPTATDAGRIVETYRTSALAFSTPGANAQQVVREQYVQWQGTGTQAGSPGELSPEPWQRPDFNRAVSFLREHPAVLKELGLIVELSVKVDDLLALPTQSRLIRVRFTPAVADSDFGLAPVTPWTRFAFDGRRFLPAPGPNSDLNRGMVDLTRAAPIGSRRPAASDKWGLVTFDVGGGVGRLRDAARSRGAAPGAPSNVSLPVLHSTGIGIVRNGRGEGMRQRANNSARSNTAADLHARELTADDLVLGYRVDIKGESGGWRSVCARTATYRIDDLPVGAPAQPEEGHVKANAAVVGNDRVLRSDEVVARWSGWNLALPRPTFDEQGRRPDERLRPDLPFNLIYDFDNPAAPLPQLRYGRGYSLRMRVADMAGGGIRVTDEATSDEFATDFLLYRRHDPIPPPEIAPPAGMFVTDPQRGQVPNPKIFGPGGSIDVLVIRSDPEGDARLDVAGFAAAHPGYPRNDLRTIVPPPTTFAIAEQYDALNGDDEETWNRVKRTMVPPAVTRDGEYTWLPDPAAIGVAAAVRAGTGSSGQTPRSGWIGAWPDHLPKTVRLLPPDPAQSMLMWTATIPGGPDDTDALIVRLKPGDQADVDVSSFPSSTDIDKFEISDWVAGSDQTLLAQGRHPMMTPPLGLQLIHAVRRPLKRPSGTLGVSRNAAENFASLRGQGDPLVGVEPHSTGQVDVAAEWNEFIDDEVAPRSERVRSLALDRGANALPAFRHEFGDTRHRRLTYTLTAVSRFRQFFDPDADDAFENAGALPVVIIPSSARPPAPVVLAAVPAFGWERGAPSPGLAQPVRRRRLGGRVRVELARPWNVSGEEERLAVLVKPTESPPPAAMDRLFTRIQRDPIWATNPAAGLAHPSMFGGMAGDIATCSLADVDARGLAAPFAVHFDKESDRWFADVVMPGAIGTSYSPFVRLVVARYQKESLDGCELSATATTEFVQLMPDRSLSIDRLDDGSARVILEGIGPAGPRPNRVIAQVERAFPGDDGSVSDITSASPDQPGLWHRLDGHATSAPLGRAMVLPLPGGEGELRIMVREIEDIDGVASVDGDGPLAGDLRQRTVFIDTVRI